MEIEVTKIIEDMPNVYGSIATHGNNAGEITYNNAKIYCESEFALRADQRKAVKDHIQEFGAWPKSEIDSWTDNELDALFVQLVIAEYEESKPEFNTGRIFIAEKIWKDSPDKYYYEV